MKPKYPIAFAALLSASLGVPAASAQLAHPAAPVLSVQSAMQARASTGPSAAATALTATQAAAEATAAAQDAARAASSTTSPSVHAASHTAQSAAHTAKAAAQTAVAAARAASTQTGEASTRAAATARQAAATAHEAAQDATHASRVAVAAVSGTAVGAHAPATVTADHAAHASTTAVALNPATATTRITTDAEGRLVTQAGDSPVLLDGDAREQLEASLAAGPVSEQVRATTLATRDQAIAVVREKAAVAQTSLAAIRRTAHRWEEGAREKVGRALDRAEDRYFELNERIEEIAAAATERAYARASTRLARAYEKFADHTADALELAVRQGVTVEIASGPTTSLRVASAH